MPSSAPLIAARATFDLNSEWVRLFRLMASLQSLSLTVEETLITVQAGGFRSGCLELGALDMYLKVQ